ncbi:MAG: hypothetical protein P1U35_13820 [Cycloclasticus sp.]|nr:hypothetical protein [Cycloclasticus sp.]
MINGDLKELITDWICQLNASVDLPVVVEQKFNPEGIISFLTSEGDDISEWLFYG